MDAVCDGGGPAAEVGEWGFIEEAEGFEGREAARACDDGWDVQVLLEGLGWGGGGHGVILG